MDKVNLNELAGILSEKLGMDRKVTQRFVNSIVAVVQAGIEKDRLVKIKGLGTFKVIDVEARESVNVNTGERLLIEGHSKLAFAPDAAMKELVNKPFSQFETIVLNDGVDFEEEPRTEDEAAADEAAAIEEEILAEETIDDEAAVEEEEEVIEEEAPVAEKQASKLVEQASNLVEQASIVKEEAPVVEEKAPLAEEEEKIAPLIGETPEPVEPIDEEPQEEEEAVPQEEETEANEDEEYEEEVAEERRGTRWYWWLIVSLLALGIGFAAGYFVGHDVVKPSAVQKAQEPKAEPVKEQVANPEPVVAPEDSLQEVATETAEEATPEPVVEETPKAEEPAAQTGAQEWERYNEMDNRTKNGYYYIMGLDRIEKVREGENTERIAKRVFGAAEMACYIEVFNGITASTALEPGTEIKIPKVEPKKSVNRRLQQQQQQ